MNHVMSREVGDIGFYPYETGILKLRSTNREKRNMFANLHLRITEGELGSKIISTLEWTKTT